MRFTLFLLALLFTVSAFAQDAPERVYFVGNSVTDTVRFDAFAKMCAAGGHPVEWGRHVIPGAPLFGPWSSAAEGRNVGFTREPYGNSVKALGGFPWDIITLQPFDRHMKNEHRHTDGRVEQQGDLWAAEQYINAAVKQNPDVKVYVYARWPRVHVNGRPASYKKDAYLDPQTPAATQPANIDDWGKLWLRTYTEGKWDNANESRDYFHKLTRALREQHPDLAQPVRMIPVGHVMHALDERMKAGEIPGHATVWELYNDGIHLGDKGAYLVGATFYATFFGARPLDSFGEFYKVTDAAFVARVNDIIWQTVQATEFTGVEAR